MKTEEVDEKPSNITSKPQISQFPKPGHQLSGNTHNRVGHKENTQVAVEVDNLVEVKVKVAEKGTWREIPYAMGTKCNFGQGGQIWNTPKLPVWTAVRAIQFHMYLVHGCDGVLQEESLSDPSLIMSQITSGNNIVDTQTTMVSLHCAICLFRTA